MYRKCNGSSRHEIIAEVLAAALLRLLIPGLDEGANLRVPSTAVTKELRSGAGAMRPGRRTAMVTQR